MFSECGGGEVKLYVVAIEMTLIKRTAYKDKGPWASINKQTTHNVIILSHTQF